jgi:hypothetical protein
LSIKEKIMAKKKSLEGIVSVTYTRLKNTGNFENERIGVTVEVEPGETPLDTLKRAKRFVNEQLDIEEDCIKPPKRYFGAGHGPVCVCDECM